MAAVEYKRAPFNSISAGLDSGKYLLDDFPIACQQEAESAVNDERKDREYPGKVVALDIVRLLNIATGSLIVVGLIALFMLGI